MKKMRDKMVKIGAKPVDVDQYILQTMKQQGKLDDIVVPGETGKDRRNEEIANKKQIAQKDSDHLKELC